MTDAARFDHLRGTAQDLLDAGNGTAAVAEVLAVPHEVVTDWHRSPAATAPVDPVAAERVRSGKIHFRTTLTLAAPLRFRAWHYLLALLGSADTFAEFFVERSHPGLFVVNLLFILAFAVVLGRHLGLSRILLILGPDAATVPLFWGYRRLRYSEMSDYWLVSVARGLGDDEVEGRLLTLHSRRKGTRPVEVFIDDRFPVDPAMIERLDEVKAANAVPGPLTPIRSLRKA
jgi:hypothetical protein